VANRETLESFARNLHKFTPIIQKRILKDWQNYTEESFSDSQEKVPILTGDLLRSGGFKNARITAQGIESSITYNLPYAQKIERGTTDDGKPLNYKPAGFKYSHATKQRKGGAGFLSKSIKANEPDVIGVIMKSISQAWELI